MAKIDRPATTMVGEEDRIVHATWSRSGKNLILTVAKDVRFGEANQVLLTAEQAKDLAAFLARGPDAAG